MPSPKNRVGSLVAVRGTAAVVAGRVGVKLVDAMSDSAGNAVVGMVGRVRGVVVISGTWASAELSGISPMTGVAGGSSAVCMCYSVYVMLR